MAGAFAVCVCVCVCVCLYMYIKCLLILIFCLRFTHVHKSFDECHRTIWKLLVFFKALFATTHMSSILSGNITHSVNSIVYTWALSKFIKCNTVVISNWGFKNLRKTSTFHCWYNYIPFVWVYYTVLTCQYQIKCEHCKRRNTLMDTMQQPRQCCAKSFWNGHNVFLLWKIQHTTLEQHNSTYTCAGVCMCVWTNLNMPKKKEAISIFYI